MIIDHYYKRLSLLEAILNESQYLLSNGEFPIYHLNSEPIPDEIYIHFQPLQTPQPPSQTVLNENAEIVSIENYLTRNFSCTKCLDRSRGIRNFLSRGRKKILFLHYSGATKPNEKLTKTGKTILKSQLAQEELASVIKNSFSLPLEEFFFQEFPACHFNPNLNPQEWERRCKNCEYHILETVRKEDIKLIIILGNSAILRWSKEFCNENLGRVFLWELEEGFKIPSMILRSPEALLFAKSKSNEEYKSLKNTMQEQLKGFIQNYGEL